MCKYFRNQPDLIWSLSLDFRRGSKLSLSYPRGGSSFGGRSLGPQWLGLTVLLRGLGVDTVQEEGTRYLV